MKQYPTISKQTQNIYIYAFDKLDGSNIRAEWDRKNGLSKFGSRHHLIDHTDELLGESIQLIKAKYEQQLSDIFRRERFERATAFFEYYGPSSFAGRHEKNETHDVKLFDIDVFKKGVIGPREFLRIAGHLDIPNFIYQGNLNHEFISSVKDGTAIGVTFEGVVCKSNELDKHRQTIMFKIKSEAWMQKLKTLCKGDEKLFEQLA